MWVHSIFWGSELAFLGRDVDYKPAEFMGIFSCVRKRMMGKRELRKREKEKRKEKEKKQKREGKERKGEKKKENKKKKPVTRGIR